MTGIILLFPPPPPPPSKRFFSAALVGYLRDIEQSDTESSLTLCIIN